MWRNTLQEDQTGLVGSTLFVAGEMAGFLVGYVELSHLRKTVSVKLAEEGWNTAQGGW